MSILGYQLGKCKWCEYFCQDKVPSNDSGMCGLDWKLMYFEDTCSIRSFRLKADTSFHKAYYDWLHSVYKEIEKQLEDVGRHPKRDPEWLARVHAESISKPKRRGMAKHTCKRSQYKLVEVLNLDQYRHPKRNKHQYIKGLIICLECGKVFTASTKYVEYGLLGPTEEEWCLVCPKVSDEGKRLLLKHGIDITVKSGVNSICQV